MLTASRIPQLKGLLAFDTGNIVQLYPHTTLLSSVAVEIILVVQILGGVKDGPSWHNLLKTYSQGLILLAQAVMKAITKNPTVSRGGSRIS